MSKQAIQILLLEDEKAHVELIRRAFENYGDRFELTVAETLKEAREFIAETTPDLVVADLMLPDGRGVEILPPEHGAHHFPVVVMTSQGDEAVAVEAMKAGALDYVVKSSEILADMPHIVERALREWGIIVDRWRAEKALRESEERYRILFEGLSDAVFVHAMEDDGRPGRFLQINDMACQRLGYSRDELLSLTPKDITTSEEFEKITAKRDELSSEGNVLLETIHLTKDGRRISVESNIRKFQYLGRLAALSISRDITDRKRAEEELRKQKDKFQQYLDIAGVILIAINDKGEVTLINQKGCEVLGYKEEEILDKNWFDNFLPAYLRDEVKTVSKRILAGEIESLENYENPVLTESGEERLIAWHNVDLKDDAGKTIGHLSSGEDITDQRRAEEALHESELKHRSLAENTPDIIQRFDHEYRHIYVSPAVENVVNLKASEFIGKTHRELGFNEKMCEFWEEQIGTVFAAGEPHESEFEFDGINGKVIFNWRLIPEFDEKGKIKSVLSISRDITEHRASEKDYMTLFNTMLDGFANHKMIFNDEGVPVDYRFLTVNPAFEKLTGLSTKDIIGKTVLDVLPGIESYWIETYGKVALTGEQTRFQNYSKELDKHYEVVAFQTRKGEFATIFRDITKEKLVEEELQKAQKLESIGVLAGGIAHDFNNLLQALWGNIQIVARSMEPGSENAAILEESEKACKRARDLTHQLLTFSTGGAPIKKIVQLAPLIKESCNFALSGSNTRCHYLLPDDLWAVFADKGQLDQALSNISINADQAMPDGGSIKISAENRVDTVFFDDGKYVEISIEDQGTGMPEEHISRIFDPYFTTKEKGRGLGLATCYSIIKKHGGHIHVESNRDKGTTFHIFLPAYEEEIPRKEKKEILLTGHGKILIMDDEEQGKIIGGKMLNHLGYEVEFASDGAEAIEMYKKVESSDEPYAAVILDLTIPGGMGGRKCIKKLLEIDPNIRAIVASGYSSDPVLSNFDAYGFKGMIAKPFTIEELGNVLNKVIGED